MIESLDARRDERVEFLPRKRLAARQEPMAACPMLKSLIISALAVMVSRQIEMGGDAVFVKRRAFAGRERREPPGALHGVVLAAGSVGERQPSSDDKDFRIAVRFGYGVEFALGVEVAPEMQQRYRLVGAPVRAVAAGGRRSVEQSQRLGRLFVEQQRIGEIEPRRDAAGIARDHAFEPPHRFVLLAGEKSEPGGGGNERAVMGAGSEPFEDCGLRRVDFTPAGQYEDEINPGLRVGAVKMDRPDESLLRLGEPAGGNLGAPHGAQGRRRLRRDDHRPARCGAGAGAWPSASNAADNPPGSLGRRRAASRRGETLPRRGRNAPPPAEQSEMQRRQRVSGSAAPDGRKFLQPVERPAGARQRQPAQPPGVGVAGRMSERGGEKHGGGVIIARLVSSGAGA